MPPISRSPKRKRARRYFSASAATGLHYGSELSEFYASSSTTGTAHRPELSTSSADDFTILRERKSNISMNDDDSSRDYDSIVSQPERHSFGLDERPVLAYSSLPPTPITSSSPEIPSPPSRTTVFINQQPTQHHEPPFSLLDYLREELLATDFDSHQELKWERVSNFISMPIAMEKARLSFCTSSFHSDRHAADLRLWHDCLSGFISIYLHYSTNSICLCFLATVCRHVHPRITSTVAKSGHPTHVAYHRVYRRARAFDRRE